MRDQGDLPLWRQVLLIAAVGVSRRCPPRAVREPVFVTSEGHPGARLQRALADGNLTVAEQAAFEVPFVPLAEARALAELYAEKGDRKFERAALKYLRLGTWRRRTCRADVAQVAAVLAERARCLLGVVSMVACREKLATARDVTTCCAVTHARAVSLVFSGSAWRSQC